LVVLLECGVAGGFVPPLAAAVAAAAAAAAAALAMAACTQKETPHGRCMLALLAADRHQPAGTHARRRAA